MALTLTEAAKLSNDVVQQGVIETVVRESPVLSLLPFIDMVGNALTYNRENAMASAAFFDVGDTPVRDSVVSEVHTADIRIESEFKPADFESDVERLVEVWGHAESGGVPSLGLREIILRSFEL